MKPYRFTKQGKALSCEVRDIHVIVRRKVITGFQTIPNRAAVKFTAKDKYCRSYVEEAFNQELVGTGYEQQRRIMLFCIWSFATSKAKYVCCGSTKVVIESQVVFSTR